MPVSSLDSHDPQKQINFPVKSCGSPILHKSVQPGDGILHGILGGHEGRENIPSHRKTTPRGVITAEARGQLTDIPLTLPTIFLTPRLIFCVETTKIQKAVKRSKPCVVLVSMYPTSWKSHEQLRSSGSVALPRGVKRGKKWTSYNNMDEPHKDRK